MRKLISFFVFVVALSGFMSVVAGGDANSNARNERRDILDSLEVLSRFIFDCTRKNDFKSYAARIPTKAQINELIAAARKSDTTAFLLDIDELEERINDQFAKIQPGFVETYQDGLEAGIDWKKAVYTRTIFEVSNEPGFVMAKLRIFFTHEGSNYELYLRDIVKIGKRWYNFSNMRFEDPDAYDYESMDSTTTYVDTMPMTPDTSQIR